MTFRWGHQLERWFMGRTVHAGLTNIFWKCEKFLSEHKLPLDKSPFLACSCRNYTKFSRKAASALTSFENYLRRSRPQAESAPSQAENSLNSRTMWIHRMLCVHCTVNGFARLAQLTGERARRRFSSAAEPRTRSYNTTRGGNCAVAHIRWSCVLNGNAKANAWARIGAGWLAGWLCVCVHVIQCAASCLCFCSFLLAFLRTHKNAVRFSHLFSPAPRIFCHSFHRVCLSFSRMRARASVASRMNRKMSLSLSFLKRAYSIDCQPLCNAQLPAHNQCVLIEYDGIIGYMSVVAAFAIALRHTCSCVAIAPHPRQCLMGIKMMIRINKWETRTVYGPNGRAIRMIRWKRVRYNYSNRNRNQPMGKWVECQRYCWWISSELFRWSHYYRFVSDGSIAMSTLC